MDAPAFAFVGAVAPEWLATDLHGRPAIGAWLRDAARVFARPNMLARYHEAAAQFAACGDGETILSFELAGAPVDRLAPEQRAVWRLYRAWTEEMQRDLMDRLRQGSLVACGARIGRDIEWIRALDWWKLKAAPGQSNTVCGGGVVYQAVKVIDPATAPIKKTDSGTATPRRHGGGKSYAAQDQPLIEEMHRLLTAIPLAADSPWEATDRVADKAAGGGTREAKRRRLLARYQDWLSSVQG